MRDNLMPAMFGRRTSLGHGMVIVNNAARPSKSGEFLSADRRPQRTTKNMRRVICMWGKSGGWGGQPIPNGCNDDGDNNVFRSHPSAASHRGSRESAGQGVVRVGDIQETTRRSRTTEKQVMPLLEEALFLGDQRKESRMAGLSPLGWRDGRVRMGQGVANVKHAKREY